MRCPLQNKRFHGREWAFAKLGAYLDSRAQDDGVPGVLVVGGPGAGKTSLCCELLWPTRPLQPQSLLSHRVLAYHFCQRADRDSLDGVQMVSNVVQQLLHSSHLPRLRAAVDASPELQARLDPVAIANGPREALEKGILEQLRREPPPSEPLMILVDSLQEAAEAEGSQLLSIVACLASKLPPWVLLVATSRRADASVSRAVAGFRKLCLDDLRRSAVVKDVQSYILGRLDAEEGLKQQLDAETAEMLNQLHIKSAGCLLYLEMVLDGVRDGFLRLREVQHMPCTLNGLYLWLAQRIFSKRASFEAARLVLDVMLASRTPLRLPEVLEIAVCRQPSLEHGALIAILKSLDQIVVEFKAAAPASADKFLLIIHSSFAEWLLDVKHCTRRFLCSLHEGHAALALWSAARGAELRPEEVPTLAYHLAHAGPALFGKRAGLGPAFLLQCGAPVSELVLSAPAFDAATTRLLLDAGADFTQLGREAPESHSPGGGGSESSGTTRSESEVMADEARLDPEGRTAVHQAAGDGRQSSLARLLARGAYCDAEDGSGETPLATAARLGHAAVAEQLLAAGAEPGRPGADGWTPLRCAAWGGHLDTVQVLLKAHAAPDHCGSDGRTALRAAAWGGHEEVLKLLLKAGADPQKADAEGRVPLMAAAYMGHSEIVDVLLKAGADPDHRDNEGCTALSVAAVCSSQSGSHASVARLLLGGGADGDGQDAYGRTALLLAAMEGNAEMCRVLLDGGADVDLPDALHNTPFLAGAACGSVDVVHLLLSAGAAPDAIDGEGRTALSVAAMQGSGAVVGALLDRGLDEMHRDNAGWLPLHHAAAEGQTSVVEVLCARNIAVVEEAEHAGRTGLFLAAEEGHQETLATLLRLGAPVDAAAADGRTALRAAASSGRISVCRTLHKAGADLEARDIDGTSILSALILEAELELAELFLGLGCRVNAPDGHGRTPLYVAAWQNDVAALELLLKYGADIDAPDADGRTPLMAALWQGCLDAFRLLVRRRADLNATCLEGASALSVAAQLGLEEAVAVLLRAGADLAHRDGYGRTAADVAERAGKLRIANILRAASTASPPLRSRGSHSSSGFGGSHMEHSLDSAAALSPLPEDGPLETALSPRLLQKTVVTAADGSKQSTLSSCGSPDGDFRGQLLERSLPRPASMRLSVCLPEDFDALKDPMGQSLSSGTTTESGFGSTRRRPGIATNPKCRQSSSGSLRSSTTERTHAQMRRAAARLGQIQSPPSASPQVVTAHVH